MTDPKSWLNRTVIGAGATSFLADLSYETAFSVLPGFISKLGASPAILGAIEGTADALASFVKLGSGSWSDAVGRRKPFAVAGYALTGLMSAALAVAAIWPVVALARIVGWFGKGLRGPARDALLSASIPAEHRGKAFGLHRTCDTLGAVLGPLIGAQLLEMYSATLDIPQRAVLAWAVVPGVLSALAFWLLVKEQRNAVVKKYRFGTAVRQLPPTYRRYLVGVGVFGASDFSPLLLIVAATTTLAPSLGDNQAAVLAARLYALRNLCTALTAFPVGALSDRGGRRMLLAGGYALAAIVFAGFAAACAWSITSMYIWVCLFALAGGYIAIEDALESAIVADLVSDATLRGTAYGVLGAVNGGGDFLASLVVGLLITWAAPAGFIYAAVLAILGAAVTAQTARTRQ